MVEAAEVGDEVLADAAPVAAGFDDLEVLIVAAVGVHPLDANEHIVPGQYPSGTSIRFIRRQPV